MSRAHRIGAPASGWRGRLTRLLRPGKYRREAASRQLARCREAGVFDPDWYAAANPDVVAAGLDPGLHFLAHGLAERRQPCPWFSWDRHEALLRQAVEAPDTPWPDSTAWAIGPEAALTLEADGSCTPAAWADYLRQLAAFRAQNPPRPSAQAARLVVCLRPGPAPGLAPDPRPDPAPWRRSLAAVAALSPRDGLAVTVVCLGEAPPSVCPRELPVVADLAGLAAFAGPEAMVWLLFAGDAPSPDALDVLATGWALAAPAALCDMSFTERDRVYPWLVHGCDPVQAALADSHLGRFLLRGDGLARVGADRTAPVEAGLREALLAALAAGEAAHAVGPILDIVCSRAGVQRLRQDLRQRALGDTVTAVQAGASASVAVVVSTRNGGAMCAGLLGRLLAEPLVAEVVVVDNGSDDPATVGMLTALAAADRLTVVPYERAFNFSAQCNLGVAHTTAPTVLLVNDDMLPVSPDWLWRLTETLAAAGPERTVVGPLLLYPDYTVQQAGMCLGGPSGPAHVLRQARPDREALHFFFEAPRRVSCLTGAALLVSRRFYETLNGLDAMLATSYQDVDFSLRVRAGGGQLVFEPRANLLHFESVSVRQALARPGQAGAREAEWGYCLARWGERLFREPWLSPLVAPGETGLRRLGLAGARGMGRDAI